MTALGLGLGLTIGSGRVGTGGGGNGGGEPALVEIPEDSDFTDQGFIISPDVGEWDARIHGMISPCAVVEVGGDLILYYIGADGDRGDGGPAHRKLGAAVLAQGADVTSAWTKAGGNPLVEHNPNPLDGNEDEEGVFSAGALFDGADVQVVFGGMEVSGGAGVDGLVPLPSATTVNDRTSSSQRITTA